MKKSIKILCSVAVSIMTILTLFPVVAKATTIPIKEANGEKVVQIDELVTALKGDIITTDDGTTTYSINGKVITVSTNDTAFFSVSKDLVGEIIPYKTMEIKGITLPDCEASAETDENGKLLFPVSALEHYIGISPSEEGFVIEDVNDETDSNETVDTGSTSNSNGSSSTGGSSSSNNSSSGSSSSSSSSSGSGLSNTSNGGSSSTGGSSSSNTGSSSSGSSSSGTSNSGSASTGNSGSSNNSGSTQPTQPTVSKVPMSTLTSKLPGFGWTKYSDYDYLYSTIGGIHISGESMSMHLYGYSTDFYNSVSNVLYTIIPSGASKALSMLSSDTSGSFSSDGRSVRITYVDGSPEVYIN